MIFGVHYYYLDQVKIQYYVETRYTTNMIEAEK